MSGHHRWPPRRRLRRLWDALDQLVTGETQICRYGHAHTGDYALEDRIECDCDHNEADWFDPDPDGFVMCVCGHVIADGGSVSPRTAIWTNKPEKER